MCSPRPPAAQACQWGQRKIRRHAQTFGQQNGKCSTSFSDVLPGCEHIRQGSEMPSLVVSLHMRMRFPCAPEAAATSQQDDLSSSHRLHSAPVLVVAVLDGENHLRISRGDPLHSLILCPRSASALLLSAGRVNLAAEQQDASVRHRGRLAHPSLVMCHCIFLPLGLTVLPRDAVGTIAHSVTSASHLDWM